MSGMDADTEAVRETGVGAVDAALARLGELDGVPVEARVDVFEDVHARLRAALTELDERPGPRPGP